MSKRLKRGQILQSIKLQLTLYFELMICSSEDVWIGSKCVNFLVMLCVHNQIYLILVEHNLNIKVVLLHISLQITPFVLIGSFNYMYWQ